MLRYLPADLARLYAMIGQLEPRLRRPAYQKLRRVAYRARNKAYPYSNTRQHKRYARQLAAGQLEFVQHKQRGL